MSHRGAYLSVATAAVLWGTWKLVLGPAHLPAAWAAFVAFVTLSVAGAPLLLARGRSIPSLGRTDVAWFALLGAGDAMNNLLFFGAMERTTVAIAVLSHYLAPSFVVVMAPWLARTPHVRGAVGYALVATAGLSLVLAPWRGGGLAGHDLAGAVFGAASAVCYALNVCASRRMNDRFTPEQVLVLHAPVAALALAPFVPWAVHPAAWQLARVAGGALVLSLLAGALFLRGVARLPPAHVAALTFLEPLTAVTIGAVVLGERLPFSAALGVPVVLAAGIAATRAKPAG